AGAGAGGWSAGGGASSASDVALRGSAGGTGGGAVGSTVGSFFFLAMGGLRWVRGRPCPLRVEAGGQGGLLRGEGGGLGQQVVQANRQVDELLWVGAAPGAQGCREGVQQAPERPRRELLEGGLAPLADHLGQQAVTDHAALVGAQQHALGLHVAEVGLPE